MRQTIAKTENQASKEIQINLKKNSMNPLLK
jgi:hypothetical protein